VGYEGLLERKRPGGKQSITKEQFQSIIEEVELGDPRWRLERIAHLTQKRYKKGLKKSAVWMRLKKMVFMEKCKAVQSQSR
jgi:transposase